MPDPDVAIDLCLPAGDAAPPMTVHSTGEVPMQTQPSDLAHTLRSIADPTSREIAESLDTLLERIMSRQYGLGPSVPIFQFGQFASLAGRRNISLEGKRCVDFGCGAMRPYNVSTLLYLAGASSVMGIDFEAPFDPGGNAIGVLCTLMAIAMREFDDDTSCLQTTFGDLTRRLADFDWAELRQGNLAGIPSAIDIRTANYLYLPVEDRQFDIMVSNSVFEHIQLIDECLASFRSSMAPDGNIYASIDYRDHRAYTEQASPWQFMIDDGDYALGYINKLRHSQMEALFLKHGLSIIESDIVIQAPDPQSRAAFLSKYQDMLPSDIETTEAHVLLVAI